MKIMYVWIISIFFSGENLKEKELRVEQKIGCENEWKIMLIHENGFSCDNKESLWLTGTTEDLNRGSQPAWVIKL